MSSPRTHHRSASWTLGGGGMASGRVESANGESTTFDSLRSVICEIMPGLSAGGAAAAHLQPHSSAGDVLSRGEALLVNDVERGNVYAAPSSSNGTHAYRRSDSHGGGLGTSLGQTAAGYNGAGNGGGESSDVEDAGGSTLQSLLKWLEKGLPFCLLLSARLLWEHRLGEDNICVFMWVHACICDCIATCQG